MEKIVLTLGPRALLLVVSPIFSGPSELNAFKDFTQ